MENPTAEEIHEAIEQLAMCTGQIDEMIATIPEGDYRDFIQEMNQKLKEQCEDFPRMHAEAEAKLQEMIDRARRNIGEAQKLSLQADELLRARRASVTEHAGRVDERFEHATDDMGVREATPAVTPEVPGLFHGSPAPVELLSPELSGLVPEAIEAMSAVATDIPAGSWVHESLAIMEADDVFSSPEIYRPLHTSSSAEEMQQSG